jgi:thiopurine S-methyltransferase
MDPDFWHQRWRENRIGFHQAAPGAMLMKHIGALDLAAADRIFLPLCGKTRDIGWLLSQGFRVAGVELSRLAINQVFQDLDLSPEIVELAGVTRFSAPNLDLFVGDIFALGADQLGPVDASYDRAALVALPQDMRPRYATHMARITAAAPQLLICFEYDQSIMPGPPFSVGADELARVYGAHYKLFDHDAAPVTGGLKGICPATERVWLLR